jgi:hypothetical protein
VESTVRITVSGWDEVRTSKKEAGVGFVAVQAVRKINIKNRMRFIQSLLVRP